MNAPHVIEVIESEIMVGEGENESDPVRIVTQYHTKDGVLLAEHDEWLKHHTIVTAGLGKD